MPEADGDRGRQFMARVVHGLEDLGAAEAAGRLGALDVQTGHRQVRFRSASPLTQVVRLRTADDVFLVCGDFRAVGHTRSALPDLARQVRTFEVQTALGWIAETRAILPELGFEVVASFLGRRNYNRFEIEEAAGQALAAITGLAFRASRERSQPQPDLSFRVHLDHEDGLLGVRLAAAPLHRRPYRTATLPGSLHPPVAFGLCMLAGLSPGQLVADPFCGAGTIPIEAGFAAQGLTIVAMDIDSLALGATVENARRALQPLHLARADASALPLGQGSVDRLISNLPWLNQVPYLGRLRQHREPLWEEVSRVLAPDGQAVLLGVCQEDETPIHSAGLTRLAPARLSLSGTWTEVSVLSRKERAVTDPG